MTVDLLFLAKNRLAFTVESFRALRRNTNWERVNQLVLYDDGSTDGTLGFLERRARATGAELRQTSLGSAIRVCNDFVRRSTADLVVKIDNDAMMPPGWLDTCLGIFERHPELQLLGLEERGIAGEVPYTYQPSDWVGGLFVARRSIFAGADLPQSSRVYYGWQTWHSGRFHSGWIKPSLPVFLLDRVPFAPWSELTREYEAKGWQRPWKRYTAADAHLWAWVDSWHAGLSERAAAVA
jgi:cellulose synthase/poly-beta-1,6-N-acetylglucosamine synthase-like glycosyltransferase